MVQDKALSPSNQSESWQYEIQIYGELDGRWSQWFDGIKISIEDHEDHPPLTVLHCPPMDQAKLRGIFNKIWDMNLKLFSLRLVPTSASSADASDDYSALDTGNQTKPGEER
jgi:hypothetical protein